MGSVVTTEGPPPEAELVFFCRYLPAIKKKVLCALRVSAVKSLLPFFRP